MAACIKQMHKDYYKSVLIERESKGLRGTVVVKIEKTLYEKETLTIEQLKELDEAKKYPIVYDEDSPELTPVMEKAFWLAAIFRNKSKAVKRKGE